MEGLVPGSPEDIMRSIQMAKSGDLNKMYGAQAIGLDLNKSPEELYKDYLRKYPNAVKGMRLQSARELHMTEFGGDERFMEAQQHPEEFRRELDEVKWREEHLPKLGSEETRKLTELKNSWNDFTSVVQTRLQQATAAIAPTLTEIARTLSGDPKKGSDWEKLGKGSFADILLYTLDPGLYSRKDDILGAGKTTKDKIIQWSEDIKKFLGTPATTFKDRMDELSASIQGVITSTRDLFSRIWNLLTGTSKEGAAETFGGGRPAVGGAPATFNERWPSATPGAAPPAANGATPPAAAPGAAPAPPPPVPGTVPIMPPSFQHSMMNQQFGGNQFASFGGNRFASAASFGGNRFASAASFGGNRFASAASFGGNRFASAASFGGSRTNLAFAGGGGGGGRQSFASAAQRSVPAAGGGLNAMFSRQNNLLMAGLGGGGAPGSRGGLDIDQWQHSRTTNFTVRDVPGSNIHMSATGMG